MCQKSIAAGGGESEESANRHGAGLPMLWLLLRLRFRRHWLLLLGSPLGGLGSRPLPLFVGHDLAKQ